MANPQLTDWWASGRGRSQWCEHTVRTGSLSVYARRSVFDRDVVEVASVVSRWGYGAAWNLYRVFCADKPAIAENILNEDLDALLVRWGWTTCWRDMMETPTRANPEFLRRYPLAAESGSAGAALWKASRAATK